MPALRTHDTHSQSLEVITDALHLPTLSIISPTPRAFTFPFNKNQSCLYPSPINSPFEPDLRKLTLTPVSPTSSTSSASTSVFSSTSSLTSVSSASASCSGPASPSSHHKRRKSSTCSDIERRPRKGDEDYIKRPENAFILFRRKCCEERQLAQDEVSSSSAYTDAPTKKQRQADLSKTISQQWKALSPEERLYWEELAKEKKKEHEQMYPNYVYRPQRSKDKKGKKSKRGEFEHEMDCESSSISFMLPFAAAPSVIKHSRSASAPTPPPSCRQTIQVPTVYMPSCPTSPSMLPMISRRASHPDHSHSQSHSHSHMHSSESQFDYPSASPFSHPNAFVDANGFYHGMFENPSAPPHPLSLSMLHGGNQMISPLSSSSASSSSIIDSPLPGSGSGLGLGPGPFTPVNCLQSAFSFHDERSPLSLSLCGSTTDVNFGYDETFSWQGQGAWDNNNHGDNMLAGDEFDLNAIPPIELGIAGTGSGTGTGTCGDQHSTSGVFSVGYARETFVGATCMDVGHEYSLTTQGQLGRGHGDETFEELFNFGDMLAIPSTGF